MWEEFIGIGIGTGIGNGTGTAHAYFSEWKMPPMLFALRDNVHYWIAHTYYWLGLSLINTFFFVIEATEK
jgi:hypothetical protein